MTDLLIRYANFLLYTKIDSTNIYKNVELFISEKSKYVEFNKGDKQTLVEFTKWLIENTYKKLSLDSYVYVYDGGIISTSFLVEIYLNKVK